MNWNYLLMTKIRQFDIWLANLNPSRGTEAGKVRPVVIVQTDLLNHVHPSTLICPVTSKVNLGIKLLRVNIPKGQLDLASDVLVDQVRALDNKRLINKIGELTSTQQQKLKQNLAIVFDLYS